MGFYGNMMGGFGTAGVFGLLMGLLLVSFLVLGCIYFWREINKK